MKLMMMMKRMTPMENRKGPMSLVSSKVYFQSLRFNSLGKKTGKQKSQTIFLRFKINKFISYLNGNFSKEPIHKYYSVLLEFKQA